MKRIRYQQGTLRLEERTNGSRVWEYRWYETQLSDAGATLPGKGNVRGSRKDFRNNSDE